MLGRLNILDGHMHPKQRLCRLTVSTFRAPVLSTGRSFVDHEVKYVHCALTICTFRATDLSIGRFFVDHEVKYVY